MAEFVTSLLAGRVEKRSLPAVAAPPPPDAPELRRLQLRQGELAHFWNGQEPIRYIAYLELRPGTTRGGHFHHRKRELVYVIAGEISLVVEDPTTRNRETLVLRGGDLGLIDAGIAHLYRVTGAGQAIEFSSSPFDPADQEPWAFD